MKYLIIVLLLGLFSCSGEEEDKPFHAQYTYQEECFIAHIEPVHPYNYKMFCEFKKKDTKICTVQYQHRLSSINCSFIDALKADKENNEQ